MNLSFRSYTSGDEETYIHVWNKGYKTCSWFAKHGPTTINRAKKEIEENKKDPTYQLIFALSDKKPIGFIETKMQDERTGEILHYNPCVIPEHWQKNAASALVEAAVKHLRKSGAQKVKFSIMGRTPDTAPYLALYQARNFTIQRKAVSMTAKLDTIPEPKTHLPLKLSTLRQLNSDAFVDLFIRCFKDSKDRDASQIASNTEKTKQFIQQLRQREGEEHDPDGWIAASLEDKLVGFVVAIQERDSGLIAEIGVDPQHRRKGIGAFLTTKGLQRLKERGFNQAFLGVDLGNTEAISMYEKLGFQKLPWEMYELEAVMHQTS